LSSGCGHTDRRTENDATAKRPTTRAGKKHTSEPENARRRAGHPGGGERSPSAAHSEGWREGVPLPCLCARAVGPRARRAGGARGGAPCLLAAVAQEAGSGPAASSDSNLR
ncbi:unnamed protein product, partial [Prorocentrum cordatum]